jgi:hypothetical protein
MSRHYAIAVLAIQLRIALSTEKNPRIRQSVAIKAIRTVRANTNGSVSIIAINAQGAVSTISTIHTRPRGTKFIHMLMSVW